MAFSYCPHCGFKNMYSLQAPKFCGGCGEGLSILSAANSSSSSPVTGKKLVRRPAPARSRFQEIEVDDPDGTDVYEVPNISKLSYSIERDKNKFNLKDIVSLEQIEAMSKPEQTKPKKRGRPRKKS